MVTLLVHLLIVYIDANIVQANNSNEYLHDNFIVATIDY